MTKILLCLIIALSSTVYAKTKPLPIVSLKKAQKTSLAKTLLYPIKIMSKVSSTLKSDGDYIIVKRVAKLGQTVKKGDPLLILRHQDTSVHYENRTIKAPVDGIIASIYINEGQYIKSSDELIHINDPNQIYGKIESAAIDYQKIKKGLSAKVSVSSLGAKDITATITGIGSSIDKITGTISVELEIETENKSLLPGTIGMAEITLNKEDLLLVNEKALYYIGNDILVATLENGEVKKKKVKLGQRIKDQLEVVDGLTLGHEYISESAKFLRDGEKVEIKDDKKVK